MTIILRKITERFRLHIGNLVDPAFKKALFRDTAESARLQERYQLRRIIHEAMVMEVRETEIYGVDHRPAFFELPIVKPAIQGQSSIRRVRVEIVLNSISDIRNNQAEDPSRL